VKFVRHATFIVIIVVHVSSIHVVVVATIAEDSKLQGMRHCDGFIIKGAARDFRGFERNTGGREAIGSVAGVNNAAQSVEIL
jgi:hypothetical protein